DAGLADQESIRRFKIGGPLLIQLIHHLRRRSFKPWSAAFSKSPVVDGERINSLSAQFRCDWVPRLARGVAHVQQNHSGAWFTHRKESGPQLDSIQGRDVDVSAGSCLGGSQVGERQER